jgi:thiamine pyrophosphate-dependent acetolactate synthase large subunit-like protein
MIERRPFVQKILKNRKDNLRVVSGIGTSTWDLMSAGDNVGNFGFIGAMGQSIPFALGLAQAKPKYRILLFTGDGDTLMSLGSIATIANHPVSNLTIIVLDNESYVETGSQPTATAGKTDLELVAKGSGINNSYTVKSEDDYSKIMKTVYEEDGPSFIVVKCKAKATPLVFPYSFDGSVSINRFMDSMNS